MTIRHLKILVAVAETGSMSGAAGRLFITQPTVSQAIKELEEHYHILLFERLSKRLYITPDGQEMLSYARAVLTSFDLMEEKMNREGNSKTIRIGATLTVGTCLLGNIMKNLQAINPDLDSYVYVGNTAIIEEKLLRSELDVGIIEGSVKSPDLISIPVVEDYLILACNKDDPIASMEKVPITALNERRFVMREEGSGTRDLFEAFLRKNGVHIKTAWETNCPESIKNAIETAHCLAVISIRLVEKEATQGDIKIITNPTSQWQRHFSFVYHKDKLLSEPICQLLELAKHYDRPVIPAGSHTGSLVL